VFVFCSIPRLFVCLRMRLSTCKQYANVYVKSIFIDLECCPIQVTSNSPTASFLPHACTTLHDSTSHPFHTARSCFTLPVDSVFLYSLRNLKGHALTRLFTSPCMLLLAQFCSRFCLFFSLFVLTLSIFKAPNYMLARTLTERVV